MMDLYVPNDAKICENIELFAKDANAIRARELKVRKQEFASHYRPKICEAKRVLKNIEKRLDYNTKRSDYLRS